jgi:hypothetical protein
MSKYVKISRQEGDYKIGSYVQPIDKIADALDGEFDNFTEEASVGDKIIFEVIEMDDAEYAKLPDFAGY